MTDFRATHVEYHPVGSESAIKWCRVLGVSTGNEYYTILGPEAVQIGPPTARTYEESLQALDRSFQIQETEGLVAVGAQYHDNLLTVAARYPPNSATVTALLGAPADDANIRFVPATELAASEQLQEIAALATAWFDQAVIGREPTRMLEATWNLIEGNPNVHPHDRVARGLVYLSLSGRTREASRLVQEAALLDSLSSYDVGVVLRDYLALITSLSPVNDMEYNRILEKSGEVIKGWPADSHQDIAFYRDYLHWKENEILVARRDEGLVVNALHELDIHNIPRERKSSEQLGLTLLAFEEPNDTVKARLAVFPGAIPGDLVGMILNAVKHSFTRGRPGRWIPMMGRNRLVGHVEGTNGNVIIADNDPRPANGEIFAPLVATESSQKTEGGETVGPRIKVAIIDTILRPHAFLEGKEVDPGPEPLGKGGHSFRAGHGTFVTGIVLAQAPDAVVTVNPALDDEGRATSWDIANAILDCANDGAQIINLSLACYTIDGLSPLVFTQAINRLPAGTLVVAAAGNMANRHPPADYAGLVPDLSQAPAWPAALDNVVAVGAADPVAAGESAEFSPDAPWVDVLAPGVDIVSILPSGVGDPASPEQFATWSGTSFAAAEITGAVAAVAAVKNLGPRAAYVELLNHPPRELNFLTSENRS